MCALMQLVAVLALSPAVWGRQNLRSKLANNVWSVAGSGSRPDVNQFLMQCFITYNLQKGWFIGLSPIITANWKPAAATCGRRRLAAASDGS
jgi:hypothetical protein